jgi:hypothetical protein
MPLFLSIQGLTIWCGMAAAPMTVSMGFTFDQQELGTEAPVRPSAKQTWSLDKAGCFLQTL